MKSVYSANQIAEAVVAVMESGKERPVMFSSIFTPQRGSKRAYQLRAAAMRVWYEQFKSSPSYAQVGERFGRDRRGAARAIAYARSHRLPCAIHERAIKAALRDWHG